MFFFLLLITLLLNNLPIVGMDPTQLCIRDYNERKYEQLLARAPQVTPHAESLTGQARAHRKLAELVVTNGDALAAEKHLASAFLFFQTAASFIDSYNGDAKKYYEHFLKHGIGWDYNPETEINYFANLYQKSKFDTEKERARKAISRLAHNGNEYACNTLKKLAQNNEVTHVAPSDFLSTCTSDTHIIDCCLDKLKYKPSKTEQSDAIKELSRLSHNGNMRAQCILVSAYNNGKYNITKSPEDALLHCQNYVTALVLITDEQLLPFERFAISLCFENLCAQGDPKAITLYKYYKILMANIRSDNDTIIKFSKKNPILKLICSNYTGSHTYLERIKQIQNIHELDPAIRSILTQLLLNSPTTDPDEKFTAIHYVLGLDYYHNKKDYNKAYEHLSLCTHYAHDLYTQAVTYKSLCLMDGPITIQKITNSLDMITNRIHPLMAQANKLDTVRQRNIDAQQLIWATDSFIHQHYAMTLLEKNNYPLLYTLVNCLLHNNATFVEAIETIGAIEETIKNLSADEIKKFINIKEHSHMWQNLTALAHQKKHSSHTCQQIGKIYTFKQNIDPSDQDEAINNQKNALTYLVCSLKHKDLSAEQREYNKKLCGELAHNIGALAHNIGTLEQSFKQSMHFFDQAIIYGNIRALHTKACVISQYPEKTKYMKQEIYNLATQHIASNDDDHYRAISYNLLAQHHNELEGTENKKKIFDYTYAATQLGNYNNAFILGNFYREGIPGYLTPDTEKAFYYFSKSIEHNTNNRSSTQASYASRALLYYNQHRFQESLDDLQQNIDLNPNIDPEIHAVSLWLHGVINMHLDAQANISINNNTVRYLIDAHAQLEKTMPTKNLYVITEHLAAFTTPSKFFPLAQKATMTIFSTENPSDDAAELCYLIGAVMWCYTQAEPIKNEQRKHALDCIIYAAAHNCGHAQEFIQNLPNEERIFPEKIYHLSTACAQKMAKNSPAQAKKIQELLYDLYPQNIAQQAALITAYIQSNRDAILERYVEQMYDERSPLINTVEPQDIQKNIAFLCNNTVLTKWADNFLTNPTTASQRDKNAAIFLGSLCTYSNDSIILRKASCYLEKATSKFPMQNACIKQNRGILFFNLAKLQQPNGMMANLYYKKSAENGNAQGIIECGKACLKAAPEQNNNNGITWQTTLQWLQNIPTVLVDKNVEKLFDNYSKKYGQAALDSIGRRIQEIINSTNSLIFASTADETTKELICNLIDKYYDNNADIAQAAIKQLHALADDASHPHAYASLLLAQHYCALDNNLSRQYVEKGIANGIIQLKNGLHLLKDPTISKLLLQYIHAVFKNTTITTTHNTIKFLKTTLANYQLNCDAFAFFFKIDYGYNLKEYPEWTRIS